MKKLFKLIPAGAVLPLLALASTASTRGGVPIYGEDISVHGGNQLGLRTADILIQRVSTWINWIVAILMGLALLVFFWGIVKYIMSAGDQEKRKEGRQYMVYGIIGLAVMVSVWGLVYLLGSLVGVEPGGGVNLPGVPTIDGNTGSSNTGFSGN